MFFHPGILALLLEELLSVSMGGYGAWLALEILRGWNQGAATGTQLDLEKKAYLSSLLVKGVLWLHLFALFLFLFVLDDIHPMFKGAMCATGSLNANPVGWWTLGIMALGCLLGLAWIVLDGLDKAVAGFMAVKTKAQILLIVFPLLVSSALTMTLYFYGLEPDIMTSCCGVFFSGAGWGGHLPFLEEASLSGPLFYVCAVFYGGVCLVGVARPDLTLVRLAAPASILFFALSLWAVTWYFSPYFYSLPYHHCPFDILQSGYNFVGYPLYGALFFSCGLSLAAGLIPMPTGRLKGKVMEMRRGWLRGGLLGLALFGAISTWPLLFSGFTP